MEKNPKGGYWRLSGWKLEEYYKTKRKAKRYIRQLHKKDMWQIK